MLPISLRLNERMASIPVFSIAEEILNIYHSENYIKTNSIDSYHLIDTYPTFYKLSKVMSHNYTEKELIFIANVVYHLKGSAVSIEEFNRFFDSDIIVNYSDFQMNVDFNVINVKVENQTVFTTLFKQLIFELLFYDNVNISIVKITTNIRCMNNIERSSGTKLINHLNLKLKKGK